MSDAGKMDWGKLTVDALNKATNTPEFNASYKRWLEYIGPDNWTPIAKADYEKMMREEEQRDAQDVTDSTQRDCN